MRQLPIVMPNMIPRSSFLIASASFVLLLAIGAATSVAAAPVERATYYVAIDGNDAWSGMLRRTTVRLPRWPAHAMPSGS